ncbi:MAG: glycine cleavage system protein T [Anaerolineae bacterium]|nr:glycine cleavage system protein T [Anaerolineae bacterium]
MSALADLHRAAGAQLAPDGIPTVYTDLPTEWQAAHTGAVVFDRSHEGRVRLGGADGLGLVQRTSTNDVQRLTDGQGCATVFVSPIGRVLDRAEVWRITADESLVLAAPGRGEAVRQYIQQNIFFRDKVAPRDVTGETTQIGLHGAQAEAIAAGWGVADLALFAHREVRVDGVVVRVGRAKPLVGAHFRLVCSTADAPTVWGALLRAGAQPAGGQTFNALRIAAGVPAIGRELSEEYIPLELGLWDEVSFSKGCYTGQEIIARMESRGKLAKTLVRLGLTAPLDAPADLLLDGKRVGVITSSVTAPDGAHYAIGLVKPDHATPETRLTAGQGEATVRG